MAMLEVKDLSVYYGVIQALKGISFEVEEGDVIALIGANGAGKTTTLHALTGLIPVKSGSIVFEGKEYNLNNGVEKINYELPGAIVEEISAPVKRKKISKLLPQQGKPCLTETRAYLLVG